ncbi:hypothetical protein LJC63_00550 [Ruminococcaceae bacterium OttesenSCG-928-L11]|nr:hypothetical protein [Ruminococcaceae bacterium OttesenSCG-928-L11]
MKLTVNRSMKSKTLPIPGAVLAVSELSQCDAVAFHTGDNTVVALPAKMTAMELINAINTLHEMTVNLTVELVKSCDLCDECGLCECVGLASQEPVAIPDHILEEAGLPFDCKLVAGVDGDGNIMVEQAGYEHDLNDVPDHILNSLGECGICLADLEDRLMLGDIVYDAEKDEEECLCAECENW